MSNVGVNATRNSSNGKLLNSQLVEEIFDSIVIGAGITSPLLGEEDADVIMVDCHANAEYHTD